MPAILHNEEFITPSNKKDFTERRYSQKSVNRCNWWYSKILPIFKHSFGKDKSVPYISFSFHLPTHPSIHHKISTIKQNKTNVFTMPAYFFSIFNLFLTNLDCAIFFLSFSFFNLFIFLSISLYFKFFSFSLFLSSIYVTPLPFQQYSPSIESCIPLAWGVF